MNENIARKIPTIRNVGLARRLLSGRGLGVEGDPSLSDDRGALAFDGACRAIQEEAPADRLAFPEWLSPAKIGRFRGRAAHTCVMPCEVVRGFKDEPEALRTRRFFAADGSVARWEGFPTLCAMVGGGS